MAPGRFERERKFLVRECPRDLRRFPHERIEQGYLATGSRAAGADQVRIRRTERGAVLSVKRGAGEVRWEAEVPLSASALRELWPMTKGRRLVKTRYVVPDAAGEIELDVYAGPLKGLVVAEVERSSTRELDRFTPPGWFGPEITRNRAYSNFRLAQVKHRSNIDRSGG
jgi:CYTH domain-containing protein